MSSSIQSVTPHLSSRLWNTAASLARKVAGRIVVPVSSTEEMSDVWKLYRLTRGADSVGPAVLRELAANASR